GGYWQRKKDERSRSFAKRGRVGGWGDYGPDGPVKAGSGSQTEGAAAGEAAAEGATAVAEASRDDVKSPTAAAAAAAAARNRKGQGKSKSSGNNRGGRNPQKRRVETVHAGSYAGELGATLSEERRQLLKTRLEEDDRKAAQEKEEQEKKQAAAPSADGASADEAGSVVGPNGEGGVASSSSKKKVALLISYWGNNYQGLQINKGARTIEAELELALYLAGTISKDNFGNPRKVSWSRAGRTDKGVHAAAQVISVKLTYPNDGERETVEKINKYLPDDIRAVDIRRAPKSFDSRTRCSGRRYEYIMPTYVLAPKGYVTDLFETALEWEMAHAGGGDSSAVDDLGETADISAVAGGSIQVDAAQLAAGAPSPEAAQAENASSGAVVPSAGAVGTEASGLIHAADAVAASMETPAAGQGQVHAVGAADDDGASEYSSRSDNEGDDDDDDSQQEYEGSGDEGKEARLRQAAVELSSPAVVQRVAEQLKGYRLEPDRLEDLRGTLKGFLGTKNYHNYTNHKKATDASCKRLITSFTASDPFEHEGMEWIRLTVGGQSFIMHQIRKMVASTVDRVRGQSNPEDFTNSFLPEKINLGIAPSDGLYLERPLYEPYNKDVKRAKAHDRLLEWETGPAAEALEDFKKNKIHARILAKEQADYDFVAWLDRITRYPCNY
ncbi:unnamed protein product, partial [Ectocarpus sp. 8 AP-2014]